MRELTQGLDSSCGAGGSHTHGVGLRRGRDIFTEE